MRMNEMRDEWGYDPTVQWVRRLFGLMEKEQRAMLESLKVPPFDMRLGRVRKIALSMYEDACNRAGGGGRDRDESTLAALYRSCFIRALQQQGVGIPDGVTAVPNDHADLVEKDR